MGLVVERISEHRWVPPWVRYQHVTRYQWASQWTAGCTVFDAACGTGYGSKILAECGAKQVIGFDLSAETVEEAQRRYHADRLAFQVADATKLPVADGSCDVFVSLETIEHIENDRAYVREAARVLRPDGRFICSTPNRTLTNPGTSIEEKPFNAFHVREYSAPELESLLRELFRSVTLFGQSLYRKAYVNRLRAASGISPMLAVRWHQMRKLVGMPWDKPKRHYPVSVSATTEPEILIAVCTA